MKRNTGSHVLNIVLTLFKRNDSDIRSTGLDVLFVPFLLIFRSSHQRCSVRKGVRRNFVIFTGKHLCQSLFFDKVANFIEIETLAQIFSCEFCEISKNTFFHRTPLGAASPNFNTRKLGNLLTSQVFDTYLPPLQQFQIYRRYKFINF